MTWTQLQLATIVVLGFLLFGWYSCWQAIKNSSKHRWLVVASLLAASFSLLLLIGVVFFPGMVFEPNVPYQVGVIYLGLLFGLVSVISGLLMKSFIGIKPALMAMLICMLWLVIFYYG